MLIEPKKTLDITGFKETGVELMKAIENAVGDTQRVLITELPNQLAMTRGQFNELMELSGMPEMLDSKDRMYITKHNVMEVTIK